MSKIVIIGNSVAAVAAIETIRRGDADSDITLLCPEGVLPYNRNLLASLISRDLKELQVFVRPEKFYADLKVKVVLKENVVRISTKRKQVATTEKNHIPFESLLITDLPDVQFPPIKGVRKEGVFDAGRLSSVKSLIKYLPYADHIIVPVTNFTGFDTACALSRAGKEVLLLTATEGLLEQYFDTESGVLLKQIVEAKGMRVMTGNTVEEVLGDAEVKAVRLSSGKVIAAEAVVFDNVLPELKILAESGLIDCGKLPYGEFFNTSIAGIFACEAMTDGYDLSAAEGVAQGECAAANMRQLSSMAYNPPLVLRNFGAKVCDGFCGGITRLLEGGRERMQFDGPQNVYKKIFVFDNHLAGAIWFNALEDQARVSQALTEKIALTNNEEQFMHMSNLERHP